MAGDNNDLPLTKQQRVFADEYLLCFNGAEAARRAGYKSKPNVIGCELLAIPNIKKYISQKLSEKHMSADEALTRMADMARADVGEFIDIIDTQDRSWEVNLFEMDPDTGEIRTKKNTKLIKKLKRKEVTDKFGNTVVEVEIELHDPQAALDKILRVSGAYKDNLDLTTGGERITVRLVSDATD